MIDAKGEVLYVGKAKSIRKRIVSYARQAGHTARIMRMIAATASMEFVTTATETEALLLEANLIKRLRPRYNVLLRDDKSFPYILITAGGTPPMIAKHRGARSKPGDYYGPFASAQAGQQDDQRAGARVPDPLLQRHGVSRAARGPACCIRSSAARRRAPARSRTRTTRSWCARRRRSSPEKAGR